MLIILNISIILNKVKQLQREKVLGKKTKKELGKNLAFEGYKSPNLDYRGKNCPLK
jgi:hypothetical protein